MCLQQCDQGSDNESHSGTGSRNGRSGEGADQGVRFMRWLSPDGGSLLKHTHNLKNNGGTGVVATPDKPAPMPVCSCTALGHAELKEILADIDVLETGLPEISLILQKLGWGSELGCTVCRPVIHYYLQVSGGTMVVREIEGHSEVQVRWDDQIPMSSYARDARGWLHNFVRVGSALRCRRR